MAGFFKASELTAEPAIRTIAQCGKCGLHKSCISPKMGLSEGKEPILIISDYIRHQDDRQGELFTGLAGDSLRNMLSDLGVGLEDCSIVPALQCYPNEQTVDKQRIAMCLPNLIKVIKKVKPKLIITFGDQALSAVLRGIWKKEKGQLAKWTGNVIPLVKYGAWLAPLEHPDTLYEKDRRGELKKRDSVYWLLWKEMLEKALSHKTKELVYFDIEKLKKEMILATEKKECIKLLRKVFDSEGILAFDYETTGLKPDWDNQEIVSCSFCLNGDFTFAVPFNEFTRKPISAILRKKNLKKVAANLKFEDRWTRAKLGHPVVNWHWDTMLEAHILDNRANGITGLKFQTFVKFGIADYDSHIHSYLTSSDPSKSYGLNRIKKLSMHDLLMYNALDSYLEYHLMERQKAILKGGE